MKYLIILCFSLVLLCSYEINVGMSTAMSGPTKALGQNMYLGVNLAFKHENDLQKKLHYKITVLDDKYEPGLSAKNMRILKEASPMHDIGKVGIPDSILKKPALLDAQEWKIMKTHAQLGYEMLKHSKREILKTASIVAYEHHEKWDESGYLRGLKEEEIHIFGRITALADVFDALGSNRCYKKAWPLDKLLKLFKDERGKHFEPKLVDILFENLDDFLAIQKKYKDNN